MQGPRSVVLDMRASIKNPVTAALAIGAAALVVAACGGSDDDGGDGGATESPGSGVVSIESVAGTNVLADSQGRTLYTADVEKGRILCTGGCTSFWDPVSASAKQSKSASADLDLDLGVVKRPDGAGQLAFKGLPLYRFTQEGAGQLEGDGFVDDFNGTHFEWAAATTGAASSGSSPPSDNSPY
jgi:predicted lipoprotein with Yx(FWY)xxD motif